VRSPTGESSAGAAGARPAGAAGELVAIVGASGAASRLFNILSGLDKPTAGAVRVAGRDLMAMRARARLDYRRRTVGSSGSRPGRNLLRT